MPRSSASPPVQLEQVRDTLLAAQAALPLAGEVEALAAELRPALDRGYFSPGEELRIKELFSRYLHVRGALHQTLQSLRPMVPRFRKGTDPDAERIFLAGWLAGCMLMRSARYMVSRLHGQEQVRKLLNRADPVFGIPEGMFDRIHRGATRPAVLIRYLRAARYAEKRKDAFSALTDDPVCGPLLACLEQEQPFIEKQKRKHTAAYAKCQFFRIRSKPSRQYHAVMWGLFEASGRAIAEMRNPFHRKRVRRPVRKRLAEIMRPGDILITRHDDAMSNLFLPGFWPHAALMIGTPTQRADLGVRMTADQQARSREPVCVLEAKKDGVRFRSLRETLSVDAFVLLRPAFTREEDRRTCIERALTHEGKLYDFEFDFNRSDRLVCTEVVYRSLDGLEGLHFDLIRKAGRYTLPAQEMMRQGLERKNLQVVLAYGLKGNQLLMGSRAGNLVLRSLNP